MRTPARILISVLTGSALLALAAGTPALAQANCALYGKEALKQQQENEQRRCGFTGPEWSRDLKAHMTWCSAVSPALWQDELKKRAEQLAACAKK